MNFIIGLIEDNAGLYLSTQDYPLVYIFSKLSFYTQELLTYLPMLLANRFIDPIYTLPLFIGFTLGLNLYFSYNFYKYFFKDKKLTICLTLLFNLSPFLLFKLQNHPALFAIWPLIWGISYTISKLKNYKSAVILGIILAITILFSNYYGYFLIIFIGLYTLFDFKRLFTKTLIAFITGGIITGIFLAPYIYYNTIGVPAQSIGEKTVLVDGKEVNVIGDSWKLAKNENTIESNPYTLKRPLEDFFYFSSRPWYYILWPVDNPFYGKLTTNVVDYLQNDVGHWLTQNYFMREHSASFLGITNIMMAFLGFYHVFRLKKADEEKRIILKRLAFIALIIFVITLPPYITLKGFTLYLPSYLMYLVFPMFRSIVRLSILVGLITILFSGFGYKEIFERIKNKTVAYITVGIIFLIAVSEFIVPIQITDVSTPPKIFTYIKENTTENAVFALFPPEDSNVMLFWIKEHKRTFINPRGYVSAEFQFDSESFTDKITTCEGILEARNLGVTHILLLGRENKPYTQQREDILRTNLVVKETDIEEDFSTIYSIKPNISMYDCQTPAPSFD